MQNEDFKCAHAELMSPGQRRKKRWRILLLVADKVARRNKISNESLVIFEWSCGKLQRWRADFSV